MIKTAPDPPRLSTVRTEFSASNNSRKPLFAVCDGVDIEDALVHLSMTLKSAFETNTQVCEQTGRSLEISQALVESLLSGHQHMQPERRKRNTEVQK